MTDLADNAIIVYRDRWKLNYSGEPCVSPDSMRAAVHAVLDRAAAAITGPAACRDHPCASGSPSCFCEMARNAVLALKGK